MLARDALLPDQRGELMDVVALGIDRGMTLAGFARNGTVNVYADGPGRVTGP